MLIPVFAQAQASKTFPTDYTLMSMKQMMDADDADMAGLPVYDMDGNLLSDEMAKELMADATFIPDYYADANGKPAAMKLREPTAQEEAIFKQFYAEQKRMAALIGTPAKHFETVDMEGNPVNLADLKGSVVAINFWYIGCKPCIQEMPELNEIVTEHKDDNIKFIAIATDGKSALAKFITKRQFDYDVVPDGQALARLYNVAGYPTHCIVDQEGNIAYFKSGYSPETAIELKKTIEELLHK